MPLVNALKGIPKDAVPAALRGYANSIYTQAHRLLKELGQVDPREAASVSSELHELQIDAAELLHHNLVNGHEEIKMRFVQNINLPREKVIQRFLKRNKNKRLD
jgi:hypothetical protein